MHANSMKIMRKFKDLYVKEGSTILDVGSQVIKKHECYRSIFAGCAYTGMDIVAASNVDIVGYENIKQTYDVVISGQAMEHVNRPWDWLKNLVQYYTKYICIIAPNSHGLHRYPIDTYRYYPDGMADLFDYAGIKTEMIYKDRNDTVGIGAK